MSNENKVVNLLQAKIDRGATPDEIVLAGAAAIEGRDRLIERQMATISRLEALNVMLAEEIGRTATAVAIASLRPKVTLFLVGMLAGLIFALVF